MCRECSGALSRWRYQSWTDQESVNCFQFLVTVTLGLWTTVVQYSLVVWLKKHTHTFMVEKNSQHNLRVVFRMLLFTSNGFPVILKALELHFNLNITYGILLKGHVNHYWIWSFVKLTWVHYRETLNLGILYGHTYIHMNNWFSFIQLVTEKTLMFINWDIDWSCHHHFS